jgi:uncharacterized membrane protein YdjX (TVP38/TMEM64 family)
MGTTCELPQSVHRTRRSIRNSPSTRAALIRIGGLALVLVVTAAIGYKLGWFDYRHTLQHVARLQRSHGFGTFVVTFVIIYAAATSLGVPGMPFTVASGALFGTLLGSVLSWAGAMIGATVGYWVARTIGHDVVLRWLQRYERVDNAVADARDFDGMLRLRLIPVLPLGTVNFVGGLARVPFVAYLAATAVGVIPSTIIYTYFADSLLEGVGRGRSDALVSLIIASALLIALSLTPRLLNRNKKKAPARPALTRKVEEA